MPAMLSVYWRNRILLVLGSTACAMLLLAAAGWTSTSHGQPASSLLRSAAPPLAILATAVAFLLAVPVGNLLAGRVRPTAGFVCACVGLAALSVRGVETRDVLLMAQGRGVYLALVVELALLYAVLLAGWAVLRRLLGRTGDDDGPPRPPRAVPLDQYLLAAAAHAVAMLGGLSLLARSDAKGQVVLAVAISALFASLAATSIVRTPTSLPYWLGPALTGLTGYLAGYLASNDWMIGRTSGYFAALARPLPLDYAGAGTAGAIVGYWMSRKWWSRVEEEDAQPPMPAM